METTIKFKNNPIAFNDERTEALDEAYNIFVEAFTEYAKIHSLSESQIESFKNQILQAYVKKKATYFMEHKLVKISEYLQKSINYAINNSIDDDEREDVTRLFYYNNKKHRIRHEYQL